jgi:hypothetical protein
MTKIQLQRRRWWSSLSAIRCAAGIVIVAAIGCGSDGPPTFPVTGEVRYRDAPLADAQVTFIPTEGQGPPATGATNAGGVFHLSTFGKDDGALLGKHQVTISKMTPSTGTSESSYPTMQSVIPPTYASPMTSNLTAEVKDAQTNTFQFELVD